jgi:hypothetical protein
MEALEKKLKLKWPNYPAIILLRIYPKECKLHYSKGTCTPMFMAELFTIAKLWKQPRCPITDESIKKRSYLYMMELYSAPKKSHKEKLNFVICW